MFDRFTERARKTMVLARQASQRFHHDCIGTEHMLLGLVEEGSGVAAQVLRNHGIEPAGVRIEVERIVGPGTNLFTMGQLPFTPRAKKALELSVEEAQNLGHVYIGTEHLLLGLLREEEGIAAEVLRKFGADYGEFRAEVVELLDSGAEGDERERPGRATSPSGHAAFLELRANSIRLALEMGHTCLGTEHLLLALVQAGGPGAEALAAAGATDGAIRSAVERLRGRRPTVRLHAHELATPRATEVIRYAGEHGRHSLSNERILLGLLRIEDGLAVTVLRGLGIDLVALRADVSRRLGTE